MFLNKIFSNKKLKSTVSLLLAFSIIMSLIIPAYSAPETGKNDITANDTDASGSAIDMIVSGSASSTVDAPLNTFDYAIGDYNILRFFVSRTDGGNDPDGNEVYGGDTYYAQNDKAGHAFDFNITYTISGSQNIAAGMIKLQVPATVLHDWNGASADNVGFSIPSEDEARNDNNVTLVYKKETVTIDGKTQEVITIYNKKEISAANGANIDISYAMSKSTVDYMDSISNSDPNTKNNPMGTFWARLSLDGGTTFVTPSQVLSSNQDTFPVYIDTDATLVSTEKEVSQAGLSYDEMLAACDFVSDPALEDPSDYYYYIWNVKSKVKDVTQKYNFTVNDTAFGLTGEGGSIEKSGEIVAVKMFGKNTYTLGNTDVDKNSVKSGERTDSVVTRIRKSDIDPKKEADEKYTLKNNVAVSLVPRNDNTHVQPGTAVGTYTYYPPKKPEPVAPSFSVESHKNGIYNGSKTVANYTNISSYDLANLENDGGEIGGLTYRVDTVLRPYEHSIARDYTPQNDIRVDYQYYGREDVKQIISDDKLVFNNGSDHPLGAGDYTFTGLNVSLTVTEATYSAEQLCFLKNVLPNEDWEEGDILYLNLKTAPDGDYYAPAATVDLYNGTVTIIDTAHIRNASLPGNFSFMGDVYGWQIIYDAPHYENEFVIYPTVKLKASDNIKSWVTALRDGDPEKVVSAYLSNTADFKSLKYDNTVLREESKTGTDYLSSVKKRSNITKEYGTAVNQPLYRTYTVPWTIVASETQQTSTGTTVGVEQESGIFYDLFPESGRVDLSTLEVYDASGKKLENYQYEASVKQNYSEGKGLLTVKIKTASAGKYTLKYNTVHNWSDILEFGRYAINYVAYETGNPSIANGYPDNGGNTGLAAMADLDPETNDRKFIYAQKDIRLNALTSTTTSIEKRVAIDPDAGFTYETTVNPDSQYIYRICMANDLHTTAKDIFIMDSLENYVPSDDPAGSRWHGDLVSFDLSRLELKGAAPVVYLSHEEPNYPAFNAYISSIDDLRGTYNAGTGEYEHEWLTQAQYITKYGSIANAKGIVVDVSKDRFGNDFVLGKNGILTFDIYMHSPADMSGDPALNKTYNDIAFSAKTANESGTKDEWTTQDHTTVAFRTTGSIELDKVNANTGAPIEGILFKLTGISDYGTSVDAVLGTDKYGKAFINQLERGTYQLEETYSSADYQRDRIVRTVNVDDDGNVTVSGLQTGVFEDAMNEGVATNGTQKAKYKVSNKPRIHGDLEFYKKDYNNPSLAVVGAEFTLTGVSNYGNVISLPDTRDPDAVQLAKSDGLGRVIINDIEYGTYKLKETVYASGYSPITTEYNVTCDADGNVTIEGLTKDTAGKYVITNIPAYNFVIRKVDEIYHDQVLAGAEFKLDLVSPAEGISYESGYATSQTVRSDVTGIAAFGNLIPGTYTLTETVAPANHTKLFNTITLVISKSGGFSLYDESGDPIGDDSSIVIDRIGTEEYKSIVNRRQYNAYVRIIKKWVGKTPAFGTADFPVINLSGTEPPEELKEVMISSSLFRANFKGAKSFARADEYRKYPTIADLIAAKGAENTFDVTDRSTYSSYINNSGEPDNYDCSTTDPDTYVALVKDGSGNFTWYTNATYVYLPKLCTNLFSNFKDDSKSFSDTTEKYGGDQIYNPNLESINLKGLYPDRVTHMDGTFKGLQNLTNVDFGSGNENVFENGRNITTMAGMFHSCVKLDGEIDLGKLTTSSNLKLLSDNIATSKPKQHDGMFYHCDKVDTIKLNNLVTSDVESMNGMFRYCYDLDKIEIDYHKFTAGEKIKTIQRMFDQCSNLVKIDLRGFGTCSNLTNIKSWFAKCWKLESVDLSNFKATEGKITDVSYIFEQTSKSTTNGCQVFATGQWKCIDKVTATTVTTVDQKNPADETKFNIYGTAYKALAKASYLNINKDGIAPSVNENGYLNFGYFNAAYKYDSSGNIIGYSDAYKAFCLAEYGETLDDSAVSALAVLAEHYIDAQGNKSYFASVVEDMREDNMPVAAFEDSTPAQPSTSYVTGSVGTLKHYVDPDDASNNYDYYEVTDTVTVDGVQQDNDAKAVWRVDPTNPDRWFCDIPVYDPNAHYYVWEDPYTYTESGTLYNYRRDATQSEPKETYTGVQTITNSIESIPEVKTGTLKLTKKVTKSGEEVTTDKTKFTFTLTFTDPVGGSDVINETGTTYLGSIVLTDAQISVTLAEGETFEITDIPNGVGYTIVEQTPLPYGYYTDQATITGTIDADADEGDEKGVSNKIWENKIQVRSPVNLSVSKNAVLQKQTLIDNVVSGDYEVIELTDTEKDAEFSYTANFTLLDRGGTYTVTVGGETIATFNSDTSGNGNVTFKLKHGQTAVFNDIPTGAKCTVTEAAAADYEPAYAVGAASGSAAKNTALSTGELTLDAATEITYTNTKKIQENKRSTITLNLIKKWFKNGEDEITAEDAEAAELPNTVTVQVQQYERIPTEVSEGVFTYEIVPKSYTFSAILSKASDFTWSTVINNLYKYSSRGNLYVYKISEASVPGFESSVSGDAFGKVGDEGTDTPTVTLKNVKEPTYNFTLKKLVTGNMGNKAKKFSFHIEFANPDKDIDGLYDVYDEDGNMLRKIAVNNGRTPDVMLSSGEAMVIKRLPRGTTVTVIEIPDPEYTAVYHTDDNADAAYSSATPISVTLDTQNRSVTFTNSRSTVLPTGITEHPIAAAAAGVFMILGIIILLIRRRRYA